MGITDKKSSTPKESILKVKSHRLRSGNVKDFHGRRPNISENHEKSQRQESSNEESRKTLTNTTKSYPLKHSDHFPSHQTKNPSHHVPNLKWQTNGIGKIDINVKKEPTKPSNNFFDDHMSRWEREFCKPLIVPCPNVQFDMPYCYSEEFYSKMSAKCYVMQPFSSIGDPMVAWNSHMDEWYEKAQLALQFYRQLCEQPSRIPSPTLIFKRSVNEFSTVEPYALLGAKLCFETFHNDGVTVETNLVFQEEDEPEVFLIPDNGMTEKQPECSDMYIKSDSSIYTSSWKN